MTATTVTSAATQGPLTLLRALQHEWDTQLASHGPVPDWIADTALRHTPTPQSALETVQDPDTAARDRDRILHALLTCSTAGDQLAARTVLQVMLPKVIQLAHRLTRLQYGMREEPEEMAVEAMWTTIRSYPLRRDTSVAGNLALDALKRLHRCHVAETQRREHQILCRDDRAEAWLEHMSTLTPDQDDTASTTVVELLAQAQASGVLTDDETQLLAMRHLSESGHSWDAVAARLGISPATARKRAERARTRLRHAVHDNGRAVLSAA